MKFLIDAQLPRRLVRFLETANHDAIHTLDLPDGNRTPDAQLLEICARQDRVLISKDSDFADSFLLNQQPSRLLLISTGNITNAELEVLTAEHFTAIVETFTTSAFVELDRSGIIVRA
jgi:predicted nuclease of predicted toxin-antitoxin system